MKTTDLRTLVPINRTAIKVTSPGVHYSPPDHVCATKGMIASDFPLPMDKPKTEHQIAMIGLRRGRITVLGPYKEPTARTKKNARYVVRCDCGRYELRSTKSVVNGISGGLDDMCQKCNSIDRMKRRNISERAGVWIDP